MVQRPDGLRIHFHDEQRRQPRRPPSGCFRPPSKLTPGSDRKQMNKCFSGRRAAAPQGRCATSLFSKTLITVCHPGVLYRLQPVGGRNARFPLWATCVPPPPHHPPPSLPLQCKGRGRHVVWMCHVSFTLGQQLSCEVSRTSLYWCLLGERLLLLQHHQFEMAPTCTRTWGSRWRRSHLPPLPRCFPQSYIYLIGILCEKPTVVNY